MEFESLRPRIVCHMTMSIDGRQDARRWSRPAAGIDAAQLHRHYDQVAAQFHADGWIVGRVTMEEFAHGMPRPVAPGDVPPGLRATHVGDRAGRDVAVAIDPSGKLHYGQDHAAGDHVIAVVGEQVSDGYLRELREDGVSYLFAGPDGRDLARALATLSRDFGLDTLLLEGGGRINGAFLNAGLIDEVSVLVYPGIDGLAGVSSIFEYPGANGERPAAGQSLRHRDTELLDGGTVWLRYQVEPAPSAPITPHRSSSVGAAVRGGPRRYTGVPRGSQSSAAVVTRTARSIVESGSRALPILSV